MLVCWSVTDRRVCVRSVCVYGGMILCLNCSLAFLLLFLSVVMDDDLLGRAFLDKGSDGTSLE